MPAKKKKQKKTKKRKATTTAPGPVVYMSRDVALGRILAAFSGKDSSCSRSLPTPDRLRGNDSHFPELIPVQGKRRNQYKRCTVCLKHGVRKETKYQCEVCHEPLCPAPCFKNFHSLNDY